MCIRVSYTFWCILLFRYFVDRNRNILQIFDKSGKRTASRGFNPNRNSNDDVNEGFDVIRSHFEDEDDYCAPVSFTLLRMR